MAYLKPRAVSLPGGSRIATVYNQPNLADAYAIELPPGTARDPELLARFIFAHQPRWVAALMAFRDSCVSALGLKTGRSLRSLNDRRQRIGIFKLYETDNREVLMGEDDKHLDFRASVFYRSAEGPMGGGERGTFNSRPVPQPGRPHISRAHRSVPSSDCSGVPTTSCSARVAARDRSPILSLVELVLGI